MKQQQRHPFEHATDDSLVRVELLDDARVEVCGRRGHRAPGDRQRRRRAVYEPRASSRTRGRPLAAIDAECHGERMAARIELTLRPKADVKPLDMRTAQRIARVARADAVDLDQ